MNFQRNNGRKTNRMNGGFTLVELIISTGIFAIAATLIVGALLSVEYASKKTRMIRIASDNLSAALDNMGRTIRLGTNIHCACTANSDTNDDKVAGYTAVNCPRTDTLGSGGSGNLCLEDQEGTSGDVTDQVMYRLYNGRIQRSRNNGVNFEDLTADNINVTNLKFQVHGATYQRAQPAVTILVSATVGTTTRQKTAFNVQTTVAQRTPNNQ